MPFVDYQYKVYAYNQKQLNDWRKVRRLAYYQYLYGYRKEGAAVTEDQFMPLTGERKAPHVRKAYDVGQYAEILGHANKPIKNGNISSPRYTS